MHLHRRFGLLAAFIALTPAASAQLINVALHPDGTPSPSGAGVLGSSGDLWNGVAADNGNGSVTDLLNSAGANSGIGFDFNSPSGGSVPSLNVNSQPLPQLTNYYLFNNNGSGITADITSLGANRNFRLVLYVASDDASGGDRSLNASLNGIGYSASGDPQSTFINGENVIDEMVTSDASGKIAISLADGSSNTSSEVDLNGFQIQSVPEPCSMLVVGLGVTGILLRRRR